MSTDFHESRSIRSLRCATVILRGRTKFRRALAVIATVIGCAGLCLSACTKLDDLSAPSCTYAVAPPSASFDAAGGAGTLAVKTGSACTWTVENNAAWVTVTSGQSGTGDGTVAYTVGSNSVQTGRSASVNVAGHPVTLSQAGAAAPPPPPPPSPPPPPVPPSCTYTVVPTAASFGSAAGSGTIRVTAGAGCGWTTTSNASWITVTSGASGTASGTVNYTVAANAGTAARTGTLSVAGQTVTVTQAGAACSFTLSSMAQSVGAAGGPGSTTVTTTSGCAWTATSNVSWITVTSGASGTATGTVNYTVAANTGMAARTGTLTVAGQTVTVSQAAPPPCTYGVDPTSSSFTSLGGAATATVTTASGCAWTATSNASWIRITSGSAGTGGGTVAYAVDANLAVSNRTGTLTVAGQTVTVSQAGVLP